MAGTVTGLTMVFVCSTVVEAWELRHVPERAGRSAMPDAQAFIRLADRAMAECENAGNQMLRISGSDNLFSIRVTAERVGTVCEAAQAKLDRLPIASSVGKEGYRALDGARDRCSAIAAQRQSGADEIADDLALVAEEGKVADARSTANAMTWSLGACQSGLKAKWLL